MAFATIAKLVVTVKKGLVIRMEALYLMIAAGMSVPEVANGLLVGDIV